MLSDEEYIKSLKMMYLLHGMNYFNPTRYEEYVWFDSRIRVDKYVVLNYDTCTNIVRIKLTDKFYKKHMKPSFLNSLKDKLKDYYANRVSKNK